MSSDPQRTSEVCRISEIRFGACKVCFQYLHSWMLLKNFVAINRTSEISPTARASFSVIAILTLDLRKTSLSNGRGVDIVMSFICKRVEGLGAESSRRARIRDSYRQRRPRLRGTRSAVHTHSPAHLPMA